MRTLTISDPTMLAGEAWTPAKLPGVVAWWDASDGSTFSYGSGSEVATWASKIGAYTLGQATVSRRPARSTTIGGVPAVQFGSDDWLSVASFNMGSGQKASIWVVCAAPSGAARAIAEQSANSNSAAGAFFCYRSSDGTVQFGRNGGDGFAWSLWATSGTLTTTAKAFVGVSDGTLSTNETTGWLNGSTAGSRPLNSNITAPNRNDTLYVGSRAGSSLFSEATIGEIGVSAAAFTGDEATALTGYLMTKWGL